MRKTCVQIVHKLCSTSRTNPAVMHCVEKLLLVVGITSRLVRSLYKSFTGFLHKKFASFSDSFLVYTLCPQGLYKLLRVTYLHNTINN